MVLVNALIRAHLAHLRRLNARTATIRDRRNNLLRWEAWLAEHVPGVDLAEVEYAYFEAWQDDMQHLAIASQLTYISHLRAFYGWAHEYGHIDHNLASRLIRPRLPKKQPRAVPLDDFRVALRTARGDLIAMILLAGYLGLRVGEIAAIRREDVARERTGVYLTVHGKGGKERITPIPPQLATALDPWFRGRTGSVFLNPAGRPAPADYVTRQISGHFRGLGMAYTAHKLRHRAATRLMQLTKDVRLVQHVLGHESLATTTIYLVVGDTEAMEQVSVLGAELELDMGRPMPMVVSNDDDDPDDDGVALPCAA